MYTRQAQSENGKLIKSLSFGEATLKTEDENHEQSEIKLGRATAKLRRKFCAWFSFIYHLKLCKGVKVKKTNWQKSRLAYHDSWLTRESVARRKESVSDIRIYFIVLLPKRPSKVEKSWWKTTKEHRVSFHLKSWEWENVKIDMGL